MNAGKAGGLWLQITNSNDALPVRETTFPASGRPCHPLYGNRHEKYSDVTSYEHVLRYVIITSFIVIDSSIRQRFLFSCKWHVPPIGEVRNADRFIVEKP